MNDHAALAGYRDPHDERALAAAVNYWSDVVNKLEDEASQHGQWVEWRHHRTMSGDLMDVEWRWEPVLSRRHSNGRAFSINHDPRDWRGPRASMYVEREDEPDLVMEGWPENELVISVSVSPEIANAVLGVIHRWMNPANTLEDVLRYAAFETAIEVYEYDYPTPRIVALRKRWWWRRLTAPLRHRQLPTSAPRA